MLLEAHNLSKSFGDTKAVCDISVSIGQKEVVALIGASGSGKTTLLRLLNRLLEPDQGQLILDGLSARQTSKSDWRRRIGYAVQGGGLFPHMSIRRNIAITPRLLGWETARIDEKVRSLLTLVGLDPDIFADRRPDELSGGQKQRVNFARALAAEPDIVLMDEPFSALDAVTKDELLSDLTRLKQELGFAIVLVTHDLSEALRLADRIAVMEAGKLVQISTPTELIQSPNVRSIGEMLDAARAHASAIGAAFETAGRT